MENTRQKVLENPGNHRRCSVGTQKIAPELTPPLFQFINAVDVCMANTFQNGRQYLTISWVEVLAVWR